MWRNVVAAVALSGAMIVADGAKADCLPDTWQRHDGPIYRDRMLFGLYEAASDGHVFVTPEGRLAMIYSGDDDGWSSIKLAYGESWSEWEEWGVLLGPPRQPEVALHKETAFYLRLGPEDHRIFFIGYADEELYQAEVYMAEAPALTGPWTIAPEPVVRRGTTDGREVYLITSPSVVAHEGRLVMAYLGWNGFEDVTAVWSFVSHAGPEGRDWGAGREAAVPVGMEGQITRRPDGGFVAVATREAPDGREGIFAACADAPEGPWHDMEAPLLVLAQDNWEVDEIIAPSIIYDPKSGAPYLFYTATEHASGWRMMMAHPADR